MEQALNRGPRPGFIDEFKVLSIEFGALPPLLMNVRWSPPSKGGNTRRKPTAPPTNPEKKPTEPMNGTLDGNLGYEGKWENQPGASLHDRHSPDYYNEKDSFSSHEDAIADPPSAQDTSQDQDKDSEQGKELPDEIEDEFYAACTADFAFRSGIKFTISTKLWLNWPRDRYASLPVVLRVNLEEMSGCCRFGVTHSYSFLSFLEDPHMRITVQSEVGGDKIKFKDVPQISELVIKKLRASIHNRVVYPNSHKFRLVWPQAWWPEGADFTPYADAPEQAPNWQPPESTAEPIKVVGQPVPPSATVAQPIGESSSKPVETSARVHNVEREEMERRTVDAATAFAQSNVAHPSNYSSAKTRFNSWLAKSPGNGRQRGSFKDKHFDFDQIQTNSKPNELVEGLLPRAATAVGVENETRPPLQRTASTPGTHAGFTPQNTPATTRVLNSAINPALSYSADEDAPQEGRKRSHSAGGENLWPSLDRHSRGARPSREEVLDDLRDLRTGSGKHRKRSLGRERRLQNSNSDSDLHELERRVFSSRSITARAHSIGDLRSEMLGPLCMELLMADERKEEKERATINGDPSSNQGGNRTGGKEGGRRGRRESAMQKFLASDKIARAKNKFSQFKMKHFGDLKGKKRRESTQTSSEDNEKKRQTSMGHVGERSLDLFFSDRGDEVESHEKRDGRALSPPTTFSAAAATGPVMETHSSTSGNMNTTSSVRVQESGGGPVGISGGNNGKHVKRGSGTAGDGSGSKALSYMSSMFKTNK